ncbi:MAG: thermonuclease family protein [Hyphomonadaceae bacterium]|nr:thermonuclease family protein [Hyphomonadaceae bacterium]
MPRHPLLALAFLAGCSAGAQVQAAEPSPAWRVIDGDTIEDEATGERIRLVNIDTPETGPRARCAAERQLGDRATQRARVLIAAASRVEIARTGRSDRYQRTIAFIRVDGRDFGEQMIAEGLARPWRGRREPWCSADGALIP